MERRAAFLATGAATDTFRNWFRMLDVQQIYHPLFRSPKAF
jgi:hypothetical protein